MSYRFNIGEDVIDVGRDVSSTILAIIDGYETVYVLDAGCGNVYLSKESNLIKYDKYYFERK